MTKRNKQNFDLPTIRLGAAAALVVASACAAPILATDIAERGRAADRAPVSCGVATGTAGGMTTFRPWVRTEDARAGGYRFMLSGRGTEIDQAGGFETVARRETVLSEASVAGPPAGYRLEFTVTVDGQDYVCRADATEI